MSRRSGGWLQSGPEAAHGALRRTVKYRGCLNSDIMVRSLDKLGINLLTMAST